MLLERGLSDTNRQTIGGDFDSFLRVVGYFNSPKTEKHGNSGKATRQRAARFL